MEITKDSFEIHYLRKNINCTTNQQQDLNYKKCKHCPYAKFFVDSRDGGIYMKCMKESTTGRYIYRSDRLVGKVKCTLPEDFQEAIQQYSNAIELKMKCINYISHKKEAIYNIECNISACEDKIYELNEQILSTEKMIEEIKKEKETKDGE